MAIVRSILTPSPDEIASVSRALDAKATSEPVVREQRAHLSHPVPTWAAKISADTEISHASLDALDEAITSRIALLQSYPKGPRRDKALARHQEAAEQVASWRAELGNIPGANKDVGEHVQEADAPHDHHHAGPDSEPALSAL